MTKILLSYNAHGPTPQDNAAADHCPQSTQGIIIKRGRDDHEPHCVCGRCVCLLSSTGGSASIVLQYGALYAETQIADTHRQLAGPPLFRCIDCMTLGKVALLLQHGVQPLVLLPHPSCSLPLLLSSTSDSMFPNFPSPNTPKPSSQIEASFNTTKPSRIDR